MVDPDIFYSSCGSLLHLVLIGNSLLYQKQDYMRTQKAKGLYLQFLGTIIFLDLSGTYSRLGNIDFILKAFFNIKMPPKMMGRNRGCQVLSFFLSRLNLASVSPHVHEHLYDVKKRVENNGKKVFYQLSQGFHRQCILSQSRLPTSELPTSESCKCQKQSLKDRGSH